MTYNWYEDDATFVAYLERGQAVERYVQQRLLDEGFNVVLPSQTVRRSIKEAWKYKDQIDLLVETHTSQKVRLEVKERRDLRFTSPDDIPSNRLPLFVHAKDRWDGYSDEVRPHVVIIVSGITGAIIAVSAQSRYGWTVVKGFDRVRQQPRKWYAAPRQYWRSYEGLVTWLMKVANPPPF